MKKLFTTFLLLLWSSLVFGYQLQTSKGVMDVGYSNTEGVKATYTAVVADYDPIATATDMVVLTASPTKTIRITKIRLTGDANGNATSTIYLFKRTALNTGGTTSTVTVAKNDSTDPASTATVTKYSVNASALGTGVLIHAQHIGLPATANPTIAPGEVNWIWGDRPSRTIVLAKGSTESVAVSWGGNAVPTGTTLTMQIEWTEE